MGIAKLEPQKIIDRLCERYRALDAHLDYPKQKLPDRPSSYQYTENGLRKWEVWKYLRMIASLEYFEAAVNRLDSYWIAVEYFSGNIVVERKGAGGYNRALLERTYLIMAIDAIMSSLDILARSVSWYYDLPNIEHAGMSYRKLIQPLQKCSPDTSEILNQIYRARRFKLIREIRNLDKHVGLEIHSFKMLKVGEQKQFKIERPEPLSVPVIDDALYICLHMYLVLVDTMVEECTAHKLGYSSPNDMRAYQDKDGNWIGE